MTQGYRKIPGNICSGGLDLSPARYQCNLTGKLLSMKNFFMLAILSAVVYFGWPIIQTMIVLSPIPDPSDIKNRASGMFNQIRSSFSSGDSHARPSKEYVSNFDQAPGILGGESDDDDEEDVGRDFSKKKDLNYDSDEKEEIDNSD